MAKKKRAIGVNATPVNWVICTECGMTYWPNQPNSVSEHDLHHAVVAEVMGLVRSGWAFLMDEALLHYTSPGPSRPAEDVYDGLRAIDHAVSSSPPIRCVRRTRWIWSTPAKSLFFGDAKIMAEAAAPYADNIDPKGYLGYASDRVRAFPRWPRLYHTGIFGADRFRELGWIIGMQDLVAGANSGPPGGAWSLPHAKWGCEPRHLLAYIDRGEIGDTHERTTPNCRRMVQGLIDPVLGTRIRGRR